MEFEVKVSWESIEKYNVPSSSSLKQVIANNVDSLKYQLIDKDYTLKFNNNPLMKLMLNTNINDLINKFLGSRLDIQVTPSSLEEIRCLKSEVNSLQTQLEDIQIKKTRLIENLISNPQKEKLTNKLQSLVKPFENTDYYLKMKGKILKRMAICNESILREAKDLKDNFELLRKNETIQYYNKIMDFYLADVYSFIYKFGQLFLNNKELLQLLCDCFKETSTNFVTKINEDFVKCFNSFYKNFPLNIENCKEYINLIQPYVILYRIVKPVNDKTVVSGIESDAPIKVRFSEITYRSITEMLATFPEAKVVKQSLSLQDKDLNGVYYFFAFERDMRIYQFFNVTIEDYVYGQMLYDN